MHLLWNRSEHMKRPDFTAVATSVSIYFERERSGIPAEALTGRAIKCWNHNPCGDCISTICRGKLQPTALVSSAFLITWLISCPTITLRWWCVREMLWQVMTSLPTECADEEDRSDVKKRTPLVLLMRF